MRKHRLSASFASSAVAAGAAIGTAITTGQPATAAPATPAPKPASPEIGDLVLAAIPHLPTLVATNPFPGRDLSLTPPGHRPRLPGCVPVHRAGVVGHRYARESGRGLPGPAGRRRPEAPGPERLGPVAGLLGQARPSLS